MVNGNGQSSHFPKCTGKEKAKAKAKVKAKAKAKNKNIENFQSFFCYISWREYWIGTNDTSKCSSLKVTQDGEWKFYYSDFP